MAETDRQAEVLGLVHEGWRQLQAQKPLAAWSCWQRALQLAPQDAAAREALERLAQSPVLPAAATKVYRFRPPREEAHRRRWDAALAGRDLTDLGLAAATFAGLAEASASDTPARYNEAVCLAWMGRNVEAITALEAVVAGDCERDPDSAIEAWTLAEVLRHGAGAEALADDLDYHASISWDRVRDGDPADIPPPGCVRRPTLPIEAEGAVWEWLDRPMPPADPVPSAHELPLVLATMLERPGVLRLSSPHEDNVDRLSELLRRRLAEAGQAPDLQRTRSVLPLNLQDADVWTFRLPEGLPAEAVRELSRAAVASYYENIWIHIPRHGLGHWTRFTVGPTPYEASQAGDPATRAKLAAVVNYREQLAARPAVRTMYAGYSFDRLRRRLGLESKAADPDGPEDLGSLGRAELEALDPEILDATELFDACQSARGLRELGLAARFARVLARRDAAGLVRGEQASWPLHVLVAQELGEPGDSLDRARAWIDRAAEADREQGGGRLSRALEEYREAIAKS